MANWPAIISWTIVACLIPAFFLVEHRIPRSGGLHWQYHLYYVLIVAIAIYILPTDVKYGLYSPLGITVIGSLFPIYESIRAVCTPQGQDDKAWLQYCTCVSTVSSQTHELLSKQGYPLLFFVSAQNGSMTFSSRVFVVARFGTTSTSSFCYGCFCRGPMEPSWSMNTSPSP